jgi:hypothetical protein
MYAITIKAEDSETLYLIQRLCEKMKIETSEVFQTYSEATKERFLQLNNKIDDMLKTCGITATESIKIVLKENIANCRKISLIKFFHNHNTVGFGLRESKNYIESMLDLS